MQRPDRERANLLFDYYGALLTEHQQEVWRLYYVEDWSLMEIADAHHVTRTAIHDLLNRTAKSLEMFEAALHLVEHRHHQIRLLEHLRQAIEAAPAGTWQDQALHWIAELAGEEDRGDV
ncbi:MAG: hypothetical protein C7B44_07845 [Sulfobacillus thermosulfidooxidans]|uniref:UPF0122 protein BXT84_11775 n=1 Tax=Sulfobacillus thermotolerans TaxID=338644 RepID=A0ABM6RSY0_9FIRM|nr:hypothetical protein BXT84_11775 [Sulfobacillus thermotolerans]MCY0909437.1 hypothetical protein [Sulfobacillus thermotolerans]PSR36659.1 MAG: hypothetical protein C7B44_07845 [Sulfobacillus thermosulfidooxidans]